MTELSLIIKVKILNVDAAHSEFKFSAADYYQLQVLSSDHDAGRLHDLSQSIIIEKPDKVSLKEFSNPRTGIVEFSTSDNKKIQLGDVDIPAKICIVPSLQTAKLEIKCKMLRNPLF